MSSNTIMPRSSKMLLISSWVAWSFTLFHVTPEIFTPKGRSELSGVTLSDAMSSLLPHAQYSIESGPGSQTPVLSHILSNSLQPGIDQVFFARRLLVIVQHHVAA